MEIVDSLLLLSDEEKRLLQIYADLPFKLGKYISIENLLLDLHVKVIIENGIVERSVPAELNEICEYWRQKSNKTEALIPTYKIISTIYYEEKYRQNEAEYTRDNWGQMPVRGLYCPEDKVIRLYPEEMKSEYNGEKMHELLLSTFLHEAMHAYFDRPGHETFPYLIFVEEPLAEFGMLLHLYKNKTAENNFYDWAYKDVNGKKTCYRLGAKLMDQMLEEYEPEPTFKYLEEYKINLDKYSVIYQSWHSGAVVMPQFDHADWVETDLGSFCPQWKEVFAVNPPRYYFEDATHTLCLDGDWGLGPRFQSAPHIDFESILKIHTFSASVFNIYLGEDFFCRNYQHLSSVLRAKNYKVIISPYNKFFTLSNNRLLFNGVPALKECGGGLYQDGYPHMWGVVDEKFNKVIECKYDRIWSIDRNGFIKVEKNRKYGLFNKEGICILREEYSCIIENSDYYKILRNGKWGVVNASQEEVIPCEYDDIELFDQNGLAKVRKNSLFGFVNNQGESLTPLQYSQIIYIAEGSLYKIQCGGKWGIIDAAMNQVVPCKYEDVCPHGEYYSVCYNSLWGVIDVALNQIIPCEYHKDIEAFDQNGLAKVCKNDCYGYVDKQNKIIIPIEYKNINIELNNMYYAEDDRFHYRIDSNGNSEKCSFFSFWSDQEEICTSEDIEKDYITRRKSITECEIPYGVWEIPDEKFIKSNVETVSNSYSVRRVGNYAFYWCQHIKNINLQNVQTIGNKAFYACFSLKEIDLSQVTEIGDEAFCYCWNLEKVFLPDNPPKLGNNVFMYCKCQFVVPKRSVEIYLEDPDWNNIVSD